MLQERVDKLSESCRRYKNQIRLLVQKLKEVGIEDVNDILENNGKYLLLWMCQYIHWIAFILILYG